LFWDKTHLKEQQIALEPKFNGQKKQITYRNSLYAFDEIFAILEKKSQMICLGYFIVFRNL
jgi:hypothetical protein